MASGHIAQDSFLAVYLVIMILLTLGENVLILGAISVSRVRRVHLAQMCVFGICAVVLILPCTLVADTNRALIADQSGEFLCQLVGTVSAFLHRATTLNLCLAYVDRCLVIAYPMSYTESQRAMFSATTSICNSVAAAAFALVPFLLAPLNGVSAYRPLQNVPICVFLPASPVDRVFLFLDAFVSYGLPWLVVSTSSLGMLYIACSTATGRSKIAPLKLGTFSHSSKQSRLSESIPVAWAIDGPQKKEHQYSHPSTSNTTNCTKYSSSQIHITEFPHDCQQATQSSSYTPIPSTTSEAGPSRLRKRKSQTLGLVVEHIAEGQELPNTAEQPPRKKSLTATFYDQVTLHCDGTADWQTCTVTNGRDSATNGLRLRKSLKYGRRSRQKKIRISSSMYHKQGRSGSYPGRRKSFRKRGLRRRRSTRLNTKALFTLTCTVFVITIMTLPVFLLLLVLADESSIAQQEKAGFPARELAACLSVLSIYAVYPLLMVVADKEMKDRIVQLFKRVFEHNRGLNEASEDTLENELA